MSNIEDIKEEFHSKKIEVYKLIEIMREKGMNKADLDSLESHVFDLAVCFRNITK